MKTKFTGNVRIPAYKWNFTTLHYDRFNEIALPVSVNFVPEKYVTAWDYESLTLKDGAENPNVPENYLGGDKQPLKFKFGEDMRPFFSRRLDNSGNLKYALEWWGKYIDSQNGSERFSITWWDNNPLGFVCFDFHTLIHNKYEHRMDFQGLLVYLNNTLEFNRFTQFWITEGNYR